MESLLINETPDTPYVHLDHKKGIFDFNGNSIPENVPMFYEPILNWLESYVKNPNRKTVFNFRMKMISSSSSKIFFDILSIVDRIFEKENCIVRVNWYYNVYDDEIREIGLDYKDSLNAPFEIILTDTE
ncbi:MAG TPA: nuclear pore complex subunit [Bacteroidales bacterium]|nr:nuclear pore complex subunit [Bacteroidales bacterium]